MQEFAIRMIENTRNMNVASHAQKLSVTEDINATKDVIKNVVNVRNGFRKFFQNVATHRMFRVI